REPVAAATGSAAGAVWVPPGDRIPVAQAASSTTLRPTERWDTRITANRRPQESAHCSNNPLDRFPPPMVSNQTNNPDTGGEPGRETVLQVFGLSHATAPLALRERVVFGAETLAEHLHHARQALA